MKKASDTIHSNGRIKLFTPHSRKVIEKYYKENFPDGDYEYMSVAEARKVIMGSDYLLPRNLLLREVPLPQDNWEELW